MATPYLQHVIGSATSTQDVARSSLASVPVLVIASDQTEGRGRSGATWETAPRALATSLSFRSDPADVRPFSLMAGVAASRAIPGVGLKWPNDLLEGEAKVGGILVERTGDVVVVGLGVNLWWPGAPAGYGAIFPDDPGETRHAEVGALWGAEMMRLVGDDGWPVDEYRAVCRTIGRDITWDHDGSGRAGGVADDGGLMVETTEGQTVIYSGEVRHIRG